MVAVNMHISKHMHELTSLKTSHLSDQTSQQSIASNVERNSQTHITTSLVHNTIKLAGVCDLKLAKQMTLSNFISTGGRAIYFI